MSREIVKFVRKSNDLVEARYKFDIWETRLFTKMLTMINMDDEDFKDYRIYLRDIVREFELVKNKESYELLRQGARKLMKKTFMIPYKVDGVKRLLETPVIASLDSAILDGVRTSGEDLYIEISFHPKMKPYLLQLKKQFTEYDVRNILRLPSNYSIRIYELLKQYESIGRRKFAVQELKEILGVETEYPLYANFKQRIIIKAQNDLTQYTDINFTFEEVKKGRAVAEIIFHIRSNRVFAVGTEGVEVAQLSDDEVLVFDEIYPLVKKWVSRATVEQWLEKFPHDQIKKAVQYTLHQLQTGKSIENVGGYLQHMVKRANLQETTTPTKPKTIEKQKQPDALNIEKQRKDAQDRLKMLYTMRNEMVLNTVNRLFDEEPHLKMQMIEETKIAPLDDPDAVALFDNFYNKAASFKALVHNKVQESYPESFSELEPLNEQIEVLKKKITLL